MGNGLVYGNEIDLMDEKLFLRNSEYRRKKGTRYSVTRSEISDEEIIKSVSESMANSLGTYLDD